MNIKALITLFVVGSSSVAMARPAAPGYQGAPIVRDHRDPRAPVPPPVVVTRPAPAPAYEPIYQRPSPPPWRPLWVTLGFESRIVDGNMFFNVKQNMGKFTTLKLQSSSGKSLINRVQIQFANGKTQVVELNKYLTAASPTLTIDLAGDAARSIRNVTVVGRNARQSQFAVLAI